MPRAVKVGWKRSSSSVPPICWLTTVSWPWCAPMTLPTATRPASSLKQHFYQVSAMPFPEEVRKYNETIILGCKRKQPRVVNHRDCPYDWLEQRMAGPYRLPAACRRAAQDLPQDGAYGYRTGPAWWQRARSGSISNGPPIVPIIAPGRL